MSSFQTWTLQIAAVLLTTFFLEFLVSATFHLGVKTRILAPFFAKPGFFSPFFLSLPISFKSSDKKEVREHSLIT